MTDILKNRTKEVEYPISDGKPMAESDLHRDLGIYVIEALKQHFRTRSDAYVSGNNFIYWIEGNPRRSVSPDAYVVLGVQMRPRDCYMSWLEGGRLPNVVFEFTSKKTRREDTAKKRPLYEEELRVPEYFLFDPRGDYLNPRLQGYRLGGDHYTPLEVVNGRLHSEQLNLDLVQQGETLRLYDPVSGAWLLSPRELADQAAVEARRATAAEAEAASLRAELEELRRRLAGEGQA
jgi:Uma2 family endonuclease